MAEYKAQEQDMIFALDIGTRSIVGVVGRPVGGRLKVLDIEMAEHGSRPSSRSVTTRARAATC